jgi:hypothetical protein
MASRITVHACARAYERAVRAFRVAVVDNDRLYQLTILQPDDKLRRADRVANASMRWRTPAVAHLAATRG